MTDLMMTIIEPQAIQSVTSQLQFFSYPDCIFDLLIVQPLL